MRDAPNDRTTQVEAASTETKSAAMLASNGPANTGTLARGSLIGRYVVLAMVGSGGFGEVYAAYDPELDRRVALKLMRSAIKRTGNARQHLQSEAQALARLTHENVLRVYDFGEFDDDVYLTMEFVDGLTLKEWFAAAQRTWTEVREVMLAAGRGLAAAHSEGLVHADFKPHNILIDRKGRVLVADFGLARALYEQNRGPDDNLIPRDESRRLRTTQPKTEGKVVLAGSPAYMSPEQFRGEVDERSDQFSFCVTLFEGLYGRRPFPQTNLADLRKAVLAGVIDWPEDTRDVPPWIAQVLARGLALHPQGRFTSMDEVLAALTADPNTHHDQRRKWWLIGAATLALGLAVGLVLRPPADPTNEIAVIRLADEARAAAAKHYYVHPPVDDPQAATAYAKVLALEGLDGDHDPIADDKGQELRHEFAQTLARIANYYWQADYGRPFARDYYAQALVFDPTLDVARERSELLPGEMAELRAKAKKGEFSRNELVAAESLAALAQPNAKERVEELRKLKQRSNERSATMQERLELLERASSVLAGSSTVHRESGGITERVDVFSQPLPSAAEVNKAEAAANRPSEVGRPPRQNPSTNDTNDTNTNRAATPVDIANVRQELAAGKTELRQGKYESATYAFHRVLKLDRHNASALIGLCDAYFELGDYAKAVEFGERAVAQNGKAASYRVSLGDAYQRVLRYDDALAQYQQAATLGSASASRRLELLRQRLGQR